jgi:hypothetical protein
MIYESLAVLCALLVITLLLSRLIDSLSKQAAEDEDVQGGPDACLWERDVVPVVRADLLEWRHQWFQNHARSGTTHPGMISPFDKYLCGKESS